MKIIQELLNKLKELQTQKNTLTETINGIDSIRERQPFVESLEVVEDTIEENTDALITAFNNKISTHNPIVLNVKLQITPNLEDVDYEIEDIPSTEEGVRELIIQAYKDTIIDNIDGIIYGDPVIKEITAE